MSHGDEEKLKLIDNLPIERFSEYKELYLRAVKLEPLAFSETLEEAEKTTEEDWKKELKDVIDNKSILLFAEYNGKLIGMGAASFHKREKMKHNAFLSTLYVDPEFRGKGIGKQITEKRIELISKNLSIKNILCEIIETQTSSIELHKKLGFEINGEYKKLFCVDGKFYGEYWLQKQINQ